MSANEPTADLPVTDITKAYLTEWFADPGPDVGEPKARKVAIVGYTYSQREAPWEDEEWTIWGLNNLHRWILPKDGEPIRWGAWFDLHDRATMEADAEHVAWLEQPHPFPVWTWHPRPEWPSSKLFDGAALRRRFQTDYFTNSVSWMVAAAITTVQWAIGDGAEIAIYGVDMAEGTEYSAQRPSCEYFIGLARGMGIDVHVPDTSDLLKTAGVYGDPATNALRAKIDERITEITGRQGQADARRRQLAAEMAELEAALHQMNGALDILRYFQGTWLPPVHNPSVARESNDVRAGRED